MSLQWEGIILSQLDTLRNRAPEKNQVNIIIYADCFLHGDLTGHCQSHIYLSRFYKKAG